MSATHAHREMNLKLLLINLDNNGMILMRTLLLKSAH